MPGQLKLSELRDKLSALHGLSDDEFLHRVHTQVFPDMSAADFGRMIDRDTDRTALQQQTLKDMGPMGRVAAGAGYPVQQLINTGKRLIPGNNYGQAEAAADAAEGAPLINTPEGMLGNVAGEGALTYLGMRGLSGAANVAGRALPQAVNRTRELAALPGNTVQNAARAIPYVGRVAAPAVAGVRTVARALPGGAAQ